MKDEISKKKYAERKLEIIELFKTTPLNRRQIADKMGMANSGVGGIIAANHVIKDDHKEDGKFRHPDGFTPCMLTLTAWPRCLGNGCYWAKNGESVCLAYNAMQN